jgi:hypothetical protein
MKIIFAGLMALPSSRHGYAITPFLGACPFNKQVR